MARHLLLLDVDDTLYPGTRGVVSHVDRLINRYLIERVGVSPAVVDETRRSMWAEYGTTLHGLMYRHGIDPDDYLAFVHDIDHEALLGPDPELDAVLRRVPLLKVAFTNGSFAHAARVLDRLGVRALFFRLYALERLRYVPKPYVQAYQDVLADLHTTAADCILVEDNAGNIRAARQLGMRTVHVAGDGPGAPEADVRVASILELPDALARLA